MKRKPRYLFWFGAAAAALLLFAAGVALLVNSERFHRWIRAQVVTGIEKATGARVEMAGFEFRFPQMQARLRDLVLHGKEDPGQPPLFRASAIELRLKLLSWLRPSVDLRSLVLVRPEFHVIVYPDGSTNLPSPPEPRIRPKHPAVQILDLAVDRLDLEQGVLLFREERIPLAVRAQDFRFYWSYDFVRSAYQGRFTAASLALAVARLRTLPLAWETGFRLDRQRLELTPVKLGYRSSWCEASVVIEPWESPQARVRYTAYLRLHELRPALAWRELPARGDVSVQGQAELGSVGAQASGRVRAFNLAVETRGVRVEGVRAQADYAVGRDGLQWNNLAATLWGGRIRGNGRWSRGNDLHFEGRVESLALQAMLESIRQADIPGIGRMRIPYAARLSGPLGLSARIRGAGLSISRARAALELAPEPGEHPLGGRIEAEYDARANRLNLAPSSFLFTRSTRLDFHGVLGDQLVVNAHSSDLADLKPWLPADWLPSGQLPVELAPGGSAAFRGVVRGGLDEAELEGRLSMNAFRAVQLAFDSVETDVEASSSSLVLRKFQLRGRDLSASGAVRLPLQNWKPSTDGELSAAVSLEAADAASIVERLGRKLPVSGRLKAAISASGTTAAPQIKGHWELTRGAFFGEVVERFTAETSYRQGSLAITRLEAEAAGGRAKMLGVYNHEKDRVSRGRLSFDLTLSGIEAGALNLVRQALPGAEAKVAAQLKGEIRVTDAQAELSALFGKATLAGLSWQDVALGSLTLEASTAGSRLDVAARGKLLGADVRAESQWNLETTYPGRGAVKFGRMHISDWLARLGAAAKQPAAASRSQLPLEIVTQGDLTFEAALRAPGAWKAGLELGAVEIAPRNAGPNGAAFSLRNQGTWLITVNGQEARIRQARLAGKGGELELSGSWRFASRYPLNLRCRGSLDLGLLGVLDPELRIGGGVLLDASVRGVPVRPDLYGRIEVRDAFLNYGNLPNGLDKLNGVVFLYRDRATIEKLTAESGGGKVNLRGFVAFAEVLTYWFQLQASEVRVRYPEGVSSTMDALLTYTGSPSQSVLSGELTLRRAAFHPQTDLGSLLVRSAQRPEPPSHPALENVRLDVRIRTAPQVRLETSLTRSLQAEADLRLRGSALRPALLGRVLISQGEILFFGNRYTIDSGEVLFVNPGRIEPVVNLNLATRVRGVEVNLNINGPLNKTAVTYRSDPPLPFSDIIALLATGRTPTTAPGLVGARSEFAQSWEQAGASALVSQAITSPLAGRLQRFLGVSRLKIDPTVRGIENTPEAHLTLEQQITPDVTLVYITNLARAQQQTIRLEWDFTRNFSAVAVREANGLFGVDFLYKKRFK